MTRNLSRRIDRLAGTLAPGTCPQCQDRGLPASTVRYADGSPVPGFGDPADPTGCEQCGRISDHTRVILHHDEHAGIRTNHELRFTLEALRARNITEGGAV